MQYVNNDIKMCGTPYAICVAENEEEARLLNEFMHSLQCEKPKSKPKTDTWTTEDVGGNTETFENEDAARAHAHALCEENWYHGYNVDIYHNDAWYDTVECKLIIE